MDQIAEVTKTIGAMPTESLTLVVALAAIAVAGFAIYVVHVAASRPRNR